MKSPFSCNYLKINRYFYVIHKKIANFTLQSSFRILKTILDQQKIAENV